MVQEVIEIRTNRGQRKQMKYLPQSGAVRKLTRIRTIP